MQRALWSGLLAALVETSAASAQSARPCSELREPPLSQAVAEARRYLAERWLEVGGNFYIAYRMRSPAANPFDLTRPKQEDRSKSPAKESEEGYIWVGDLQCRLQSDRGEEVVISFIAGAAAFIEKKGAWTPPMRQRELTRIVLSRQGQQWIASERRDDYSLLAADDELRRPSPDEIPARSRKHRIPCAADQAWNGKRCAAARARAGN